MHRDYSGALIMWTWQDAQIEDHSLLEAALCDMAAHGFTGALAMLRGCRYELSDPMVIAAARFAAQAARRLGLSFWFALDPRLDQGRLNRVGETADYLLPQREPGGALPCEGEVGADGRYSVRVEYGRPRWQHMLSRVAVTYRPEAVERVFLYKKRPDGTVVPDSVRDVTDGARLFVQSALSYVEIFGRAEGLQGEGWHVLALTRFSSNYPDLGSESTRQAIVALYREYHRAGVELDGVLWDEIGYVTSYGSDRTRLPYSPAVRAEFLARHGADLADSLLWLLLDDGEGQATRVRQAYYAAVQEAVFGAQETAYAEARRLWGPYVESGIHQTWHQSANDLPHGSGDWWRGSRALSGGFTDVGHAEEWEREEHGAQLLAMAMTAVTLARYHQRPVAFYNLWGVNFGEKESPKPVQVLDWWADLMSAYGIVWLAHTYGPNGYIDNFTNWGPGYPDHPSWERFTEVNRRMGRVREITGGALPVAEVAVVYPLSAMAKLGSARANAVAEDAQRTAAGLTRRHVAADVISPSMLAEGNVEDGALWLTTPRGRQRYHSVVYPHADGLQAGEAERLAQLRKAGIPVLHDLAEAIVSPSVQAPDGALVNLFERPDGDLALVMVPADFGRPVSGTVSCRGFAMAVESLSGIVAVRFGPDGQVRDHYVHDGRIRLK